jgi:hypothetical protein
VRPKPKENADPSSSTRWMDKRAVASIVVVGAAVAVTDSTSNYSKGSSCYLFAVAYYIQKAGRATTYPRPNFAYWPPVGD